MATHWPAETLFAQFRLRIALQSFPSGPPLRPMPLGFREEHARAEIGVQLNATIWGAGDFTQTGLASTRGVAILKICSRDDPPHRVLFRNTQTLGPGKEPAFVLSPSRPGVLHTPAIGLYKRGCSAALQPRIR